MGIPADYKDSDYVDKVPVSLAVSMLPLTKEQLALQECVGGDAKQPELTLIPLTHASGNACISRRSVHTLATDRPKERVQLVMDMAVRAPPDEPQQAPLIMVSRHAWSPGIYRALRLLGKTLDIAWERAFVCSLTFNSLTAKSILVGEKPLLFGSYIPNFFVGILRCILRETNLRAPKSTYHHIAQIGEY